jgi:hypothetical protein
MFTHNDIDEMLQTTFNPTLAELFELRDKHTSIKSNLKLNKHFRKVLRDQGANPDDVTKAFSSTGYLAPLKNGHHPINLAIGAKALSNCFVIAGTDCTDEEMRQGIIRVRARYNNPRTLKTVLSTIRTAIRSLDLDNEKRLIEITRETSDTDALRTRAINFHSQRILPADLHDWYAIFAHLTQEERQWAYSHPAAAKSDILGTLAPMYMEVFKDAYEYTKTCV